MLKQSDRIIIDTNLWISFLLTNDYSKLDNIFGTQEITLILCQELINELIEVTQRPKFKKYFSISKTADLLKKIRNRGIIVEIKTKVEICRDPKDNFLLSLCIDGYATHLITGDKDLLVIRNLGETSILTITEYMENM